MTPAKPGFYWAKSSTYKWFNLITHVEGEPPFLTITAWDLGSDKLFRLEPSKIAEWGEEIPESGNFTKLIDVLKQTIENRDGTLAVVKAQRDAASEEFYEWRAVAELLKTALANDGIKADNALSFHARIEALRRYDEMVKS